jgi:chromosome segregation ATPase
METDDRSDEDRNPAVCHSSPRGTNINLEDVLVPSYMRSNSDSFCASPLPIKKMSLPTSSSKVRTLERMIGERDANIESLESVIESDTEIIGQMKDTLKKLVCEKVATDADKFSNFYLSELESKIRLQKKKNETLESECTRLLDAITTLEEHSSSQENTIEYLKSEMVNLLLAKQMEEEKLNKELDRRRSIIISLENTFKESADQSQRLVKDLHTQSSSLEDEIAQLKADNTKLRIRAMMLEEEKAMVEEEMKTEMQLLYIETGRHDIL